MGVGILPLISSIVSLIFAVTVLDQYFARRKAFQLVWGIGLLMYGVSTFTEFWAETYGVSKLDYQLWYLFGAVLVAAYLGMGTVYLLAKRRTANITMIILLAFSLYATVRILAAPIDLSGATTLTGQKVLPLDVRIIGAGVLNAFGTVALVGGAIWSAWVFWRKRILPYRVLSNILIAVGALLPAIGGSLLVFGAPREPFYVLELAGIIIIFIGFLRTKDVFGLYRFPLVHGFGRITEAKPISLKPAVSEKREAKRNAAQQNQKKK